MSELRPMPRGDAIENLVIEQMRADVRAARRRHRAWRLPRWSILATAGAAVVTVVAVTLSLVMTPTPSFAATPPMLQISRTVDTDAPQLLAALSAELRASQPPGDEGSAAKEPQRIHVQTWSLVTNPDGDLPTYVTPENHSFVRYPDGWWEQVVTAGQPYDASGRPVEDPNLPAPGTELWRTRVGPVQHTFLFPDPIPEDGPGLTELMRRIGFADESSPNEWLTLINGLLLERVLTPREEAAVLDVLATLDLRYAGTTTDRLGREAYVFETPPSDVDLIDRILIDPSGHIVAMETVYVGDDRTDIPSPAVVSYYLWEDQD